MGPSAAKYTLLRRDSLDSLASAGRTDLERHGHGRRYSLSGPDVLVEAAREADAHVGAQKMEAAVRVYGRYSRWVLFVSLGLASYIYSLDGTTTYAYLTFATSAFGGHSLISSIQTAQSIIIAVGKPVIAKVADVTSRGTAYLTVLLFYVVGYTVIASAQNVGTVAGGIIIYAVGYTGLQLLTQVLIADITTLRWRGLVSSLMTLPFILNSFVGSNIAAKVIEGPGWRWGYGMFAILVPATLAPLITTLFWGERKAKRLGIVDQLVEAASADADPYPYTDADADSLNQFPVHAKPRSYVERVRHLAEQLDLVGLVLLGAAVALVLLPLTINEKVRGGWRNASIITMLVVGVVLVFVFGLWESRFATRPVIPPRFIVNRTVVICALVGFFDFFSYYLTYTYLFAFIVVVKPWSLVNVNYFMQTMTVALTLFAIVGGVTMVYVRRYKPVVVAGLAVRVLGVGLMIRSRGANGSTAELVWTQILQGMGGGFAAVASSVGAQASVTHVDIAMVTAAVLLTTEIGGAIGSAVAGAMWTNTMPDNLAKYLPFVSPAERARLFGDIPAVLEYPRGHPIREGVILAYDDTMRVMLIAATALSAVPFVLAFFLPNWYLSDKQNAVDQADLAGDVDPAAVEREQERERDAEGRRRDD